MKRKRDQEDASENAANVNTTSTPPTNPNILPLLLVAILCNSSEFNITFPTNSIELTKLINQEKKWKRSLSQQFSRKNIENAIRNLYRESGGKEGAIDIDNDGVCNESDSRVLKSIAPFRYPNRVSRPLIITTVYPTILLAYYRCNHQRLLAVDSNIEYVSKLINQAMTRFGADGSGSGSTGDQLHRYPRNATLYRSQIRPPPPPPPPPQTTSASQPAPPPPPPPPQTATNTTAVFTWSELPMGDTLSSEKSEPTRLMTSFPGPIASLMDASKSLRLSSAAIVTNNKPTIGRLTASHNTRTVGALYSEIALAEASDWSSTDRSRYDREKANETVLQLLNSSRAVTYKERRKHGTIKNIIELINQPTASFLRHVNQYRFTGESKFREYCRHGTADECMSERMLVDGVSHACEKIHFRKLIFPHTDVQLGDCSFLDTCRHMNTCKYVHYVIEDREIQEEYLAQQHRTIEPDSPNKIQPLTVISGNGYNIGANITGSEGVGGEKTYTPLSLGMTMRAKIPAQWINCDIRKFDMSVLGKFGVIMADPPWDIHQKLPYGTLTDDEMRSLDVKSLVSDGLIFLWVTGRAMELGRECLELWGFRMVDEIVWVKTNQLQRIIRTGRTGHWLNHSKEHCLVGIKGNPQSIQRKIDTDVIVAEVRETSRKPDEIYGIIERCSPGSRKVELFGRPHNIHDGWLTLGNQLGSTYIVEPDLVNRFNAKKTEAAAAAAATAPSPTSTVNKPE